MEPFIGSILKIPSLQQGKVISFGIVNIAKKPLRQCPQLKIIRVDMSI
jgi:hypothetical protein